MPLLHGTRYNFKCLFLLELSAALIKNIFPNIMNILFLKKIERLFINGNQSLWEGGLWQVRYFTQTTGSLGGDHTKPAAPFEPTAASSRERHWLQTV